MNVARNGCASLEIAGHEPRAAVAAAELHVVRRIEALDLVGLEQRGLEQARGLGVVDVVHLAEQLQAALGGRAAALEVTRDALFQAARLADIDDVAVSAHESIDTGSIRQGAAAFGGEVVCEELLEGEELSVFALCDGARAVPLPAARDAKRLLDGDEGPNTGGMGAFSPVPGISEDEIAELVERIHVPVLAELAARGAPFVGLLYARLMLTPGGPRVLEFNCRFGDPETQSILPRLEGDLLDALTAAGNTNVTIGLAWGWHALPQGVPLTGAQAPASDPSLL